MFGARLMGGTWGAGHNFTRPEASVSESEISGVSLRLGPGAASAGAAQLGSLGAHGAHLEEHDSKLLRTKSQHQFTLHEAQPKVCNQRHQDKRSTCFRRRFSRLCWHHACLSGTSHHLQCSRCDSSTRHPIVRCCPLRFKSCWSPHSPCIDLLDFAGLLSASD